MSNNKEKRKHKLLHWQGVTMLLVLYDIIAIIVSYFGALWIRFDCRYNAIPSIYLEPYLRFILIYVVFCIFIFYILKLYRSIWRFASVVELERLIIATIITFVFHVVVITAFFKRMPISYYIFGIVLQFGFTIGVRFSYRFILLLRGRRNNSGEYVKRVMIIGAGEAGQMLLRDIKHAKETSEEVFCFIDDNPNKHGRYIDGVIIEGGRDDILSACDKYGIEKIYVAIPSADLVTRREILNICKEAGCELMNMPGVFQLRDGQVSVNQMKPVQIEDLLGRDTIKVNTEEILHALEGKTVLVTGGGGSIGSELARQIAAHNPKQLILFDIYENNVYDIQLELKKRFPYLNLVVLIGSVRDSRRIFQVFEEYKPDIVYHAAAHKHVPLMEDSPCEAVKNNAIGTYKTAYAAMANDCEKFVLISTDKAVNPTNIMGASKRLCEMIIQMFDAKIKRGEADKIPQLFIHEEDAVTDNKVVDDIQKSAKTEFVAVRFGNVLGSNGSVIPLFKKQILSGGPVTVTHPDIVRYFMTIPEAVSLVLQAGTYAEGGEIYVFDMGEPVKIDTLARNLIKLSGYKPDVDIKVEYTGLRPGEKLYEEKLMSAEGLQKTANDLIFIGQPVAFDEDEFICKLAELMESTYNNKENVKDLVGDIVLTYKI